MIIIKSLKKESLGFIFAIFASIIYAIMSAIAKLAVEISPITIVFFRNLISFFILLPLFLKQRNLKTQKINLFCLRALFGFITLNCFYYAAKNLFLVDAVLLNSTSPIFIPIIIFLGNKVKIPKEKLIAILIGFVGIFFILKPTCKFLNSFGFIGLISGISMACSMLTIKKLSKTEPTQRILFYFFVGNILLSFFPMIYTWKNFENSIMWIYLFLIGVLGFLFQFFITKAYTYAPATKVSILTYTSIIFSSILGWIFWKNILDFKTLIGTICIIIGGILAIKDKIIEEKIKT